MFSTCRHLYRLLSIGRTFARYDALFIFDGLPGGRVVRAILAPFIRRDPRRPGQRLSDALVELGPMFIKLGQALSTRPDVIGDDISKDLKDLRDQLPPFPFGDVQRIIRDEFECDIEGLWTEFEPTPVAAASIAQVHFAITSEGKPVAVKVLRPDVEELFQRDFAMFAWAARLIEYWRPRLRRLRLLEAVRTLEDSVTLEMDLRFEAAAAAEMAENFAGDLSFRVPAIDWQRTGQRVMTQERVDGIPLDQRERIIAAGLDPRVVIAHAANAFFNMVFRDGFFHADLHPGNLFVDHQGTIVAVDFGIMGRVSTEIRRILGEMLLGFLTGNYRRVAEVHFEAGWVPDTKTVDAFSQAARSIAEPILGRPINEISIARLLGQLFQVAEQFSMQTQPQLLLLQKSMLLAEGVGRKLEPSVNMWELAHPLIEQWMTDTFGPAARVRETASGVARVLERVPSVLDYADRAAAMIASGGLKLHPETVRDLGTTLKGEKGRTRLPAWLPWLLVAGLSLAILAR